MAKGFDGLIMMIRMDKHKIIIIRKIMRMKMIKEMKKANDIKLLMKM